MTPARTGIVRGAILLVAVGVVYVTVVVWQRDTVRRTQALETLEVFQRTLQSALEAQGRLPLALPATSPDGKALPAKQFTYLTMDDAQLLRDFTGPVLLGYSPPVGGVLRKDGRAVLVGERGRCTVRWLPDAELAAWKTEQDTWVKERHRQLREPQPKRP